MIHSYQNFQHGICMKFHQLMKMSSDKFLKLQMEFEDYPSMLANRRRLNMGLAGTTPSDFCINYLYSYPHNI